MNNTDIINFSQWDIDNFYSSKNSKRVSLRDIGTAPTSV